VGRYKETIHTLEFMLRCQEALTTRQLPIWRRDEMIIAGLTGRIRSLQQYELQLRDDHAHELSLRDEELVFLKQGFAAELDRRKALCCDEKAALQSQLDLIEAESKAEVDALVAAHLAANDEVSLHLTNPHVVPPDTTFQVPHQLCIIQPRAIHL
jgi:hypothetical protein